MVDPDAVILGSPGRGKGEGVNRSPAVEYLICLSFVVFLCFVLLGGGNLF